MQEFWSRVFLDNTIKQYAIVIADKLMEDLDLSISGKDTLVKIVRDRPSSPKESA